MFEAVKKIYKYIKNLNNRVDKYKNDTVIQSLPSVAYVNRAKKLIDEKKYAQAEEVLKFALDLSNQDPLVYKYLGKIREFYRDYSNALLFYQTSAKLNPQDKDIWLRVGMSSLYSDNFVNALDAFEKANKMMPNNTDVFTGWGMTYMKLKKFDMAKDKFNTAAHINKYNYSAILLSAVMEKRLGQYGIAEEKLNFLIKVAPNEGSFYEYAHLKLIQSKYDEAEFYANKALKLNNQMLPVYFLLGEIYSIGKNFSKTNDIFEKAISADLDCSSLHFEWGKCLVRLLDFNKAKEHFEIALEKEPEYIEPKIGLALVKAYEKDFSDIEFYEEKYGQNVYIQEGLGLKYLHNSDFEHAIEFFKKALKTDPKQIYNCYNLAVCYMNLKNNTKVREYFDKLLYEYPHYVKGMFEYSKWLTEIKDFEEARRKLEKAVKIEPNNIDVLNLLFFVHYTLVKKNVSEYNIKEAIVISDHAISLGRFDYYPEKQELERMLDSIRKDG